MISLVTAAALCSCAVDKGWLLTGVYTQDQTEMRAAIRSVTKSPIVSFSASSENPRNECTVTTADGRSYGAKRVRGKWHFWEVIIV